MSLLTYKVLHVLAVLFTFTALGAAIARSRAAASPDDGGHKIVGITHGVALLVVLVTGFGVLGKAGYGFPGWAIAKTAIWLLIGGSIALVRRRPQWSTAFWWILPLLGGTAAWLAIYKP